MRRGGGRPTADVGARSLHGASGLATRERMEAALNNHAVDSSAMTRCTEHLVAVSRSFSIPIRSLGPLEPAVSVAYLLCRIADEIEDDPQIELSAPRYTSFLEYLRAPSLASGAAVRATFQTGNTTRAEVRLIHDIDAVTEVLNSLSAAERRCICDWTSEMTHGMRAFTARQKAGRGLDTLSDLTRYCYFVAGTVGRMLTELFVDPSQQAQLGEHAESFGRGLQLINILKDVSEDHERGVIFIPNALLDAANVSRATLLQADCRSRAKAAIVPLLSLARTDLERGLDYIKALPNAPDVRTFCLLPLWMAIETWKLLNCSEQMFVPGASIKISRNVVGEIITRAHALAVDNDALTQLRMSFDTAPML